MLLLFQFVAHHRMYAICILLFQKEWRRKYGKLLSENRNIVLNAGQLKVHKHNSTYTQQNDSQTDCGATGAVYGVE